ncbi:MAG: Flp family type IVb pilin [Negativicutes bacterium]|nr:Flp family type IVb pilin [Negativicutes bacterium]
MLSKLLRNQKGQALIEYGLIVSLISIACIVALQSIGVNLNTMFSQIANYIHHI